MRKLLSAVNVAVGLATLVLSAPALAQKKAEPSPEQAFLAARDAVKAGQRDKLASMSERIKGHALEMYGPYWQTLPLRGEAAEAAHTAFLAQYDKSYLAERVRIDLARALARRGAARGRRLTPSAPKSPRTMPTSPATRCCGGTRKKTPLPSPKRCSSGWPRAN